MRTLLAAVALLLPLALPAGADIIASGDGTGNTSAPPVFVADGFPGWEHMGFRSNQQTIIYLGYGWILTANHVAPHQEVEVEFGGVAYPPVTGSKVRLVNPDQSDADLQVWRIHPFPGLDPLPIATSPPDPNDPNDVVILIGHGRDRGGFVTWEDIEGWMWDGTHSMRWGENLVSGFDFPFEELTENYFLVFDDPNDPNQPALPHEAIAANGDSGGAVFARDATGYWELSGLQDTLLAFAEQPPNYALFDNATLAADLSAYRDQILDVIVPECDDGIDNDGDGLIDDPNDPGCHAYWTLSELADCEDGIDNDGDGLFDYPEDPGCRNLQNASLEDPQCDDGEDNDGDGDTDYPDDDECAGAWDTEIPKGGSCGLIGIEPCAVLALARAARRGRRLRARA